MIMILTRTVCSCWAIMLVACLAAAERQSATYSVDTSATLMNPERGWHKDVRLIGGDNYAAVRTTHGMTLARSYVRLDEWRNAPLPQSLLDEHTQRFAQIRAAGIKIILRYSYNFSMQQADAPLDRVLAHIEQLRPIWQANADVIAVLQAGFIGAWGEWHTSSNGLATNTNKRIVSEAVLAALPATRMIQIRYPLYIRDRYPTPLTAEAAFTGTYQARIGVKNDSFLRNTTDAGTYEAPPSWGFDQSLKNYTIALSRFVPMGGETVEDVAYTGGNRQAGPAALAEMAQLNWDYLNRDYAQSVINPWIADGTYVEINRRLGYRLRLSAVDLPRQAVSGGTLSGLRLDLVNDGWGKVYNPRRLDLILRHRTSGAVHRVAISGDARRLLPLGGSAQSIVRDVTLPTLPTGSYAVLLHLADPVHALRDRPEYSIRLANVGTWEASTGFNALGLDLHIVTSSPSNVAPAITAQPQNRSVLAGQTATFSVTATGTPTPTFQWQKNGTNMSGAMTASYTTSATTLADHNATYRVIVTNSAGTVTSTGAKLTVSDPLDGFTPAVIGSATPPGSATFDGTTWTVSGSGADIWGNVDAFRFVSQSVSGDFIATVRVTSQSNTHAWAKAGLMLRASTSANSRHCSIFMTPSNGVAMQWRSTDGGSSSHRAGSLATAPRWLRLERRGNLITASESANNSTWQLIGSRTMNLPSAVQVGLAVTSHRNGTLSTATFTDLDLLPIASQ